MKRFGKLFIGFVGLMLLLFIQRSGVTDAACCQCADYAAEKRPDIVSLITNAGQAKNWPQKMRSNGHPELVGTIPVVGALVIFQPSVEGADPIAGHVAYVDSVTPEGNFYISEKGYPSCSCSIHTRGPISNGSGIEFLYGFDDDVNLPPTAKLVSGVQIDWPPVTEGEVVHFTFTIKNDGANNADMNVKTIFVRVTDPNGNSWEGARWDNANQVIGPNGTKEFLLNGTVPLGSPGIWQVANIEIEDSTYGWLGLNWNGHTKPSFTVTSSAPPPPPPPPNDGVKIVAGYTGGYATHEWQMVTFKDANGNPVQMEDAPYRLIANICSEIGPDPAHIDIKDKSRTGFQVRVEEDLAFDGIHNALEGICYIAISDNATYLTTRGYERITQLDPATWTTVPYGVSYGSIQPMAATIVSENGTESVHDDLNCGKTFCKMRIEEDLHLNGVHTQLEGVDWVVWANMPPGMQSGHQGSVTSFDGWKVTTFPQAFGVKPIVIARITSENGSDCVLADLKGITTTQFEVRLEECYPNDGVHANGERVSWMAVTPGVLEE